MEVGNRAQNGRGQSGLFRGKKQSGGSVKSLFCVKKEEEKIHRAKGGVPIEKGNDSPFRAHQGGKTAYSLITPSSLGKKIKVRVERKIERISLNTHQKTEGSGE